MAERIDIAIIGAGPYGLAAAAHLRAVGGDVRIFGEPLKFWRTQTPIGMHLKSPYVASDIGDPDSKLTVQDYEAVSPAPATIPIPVAWFIEYGQWFQQRAVPELDEREVRSVAHSDARFRVEVNGDTYHADRVVVAAGVGKFAHRPCQFAALGPHLVSHTLDHHDLGIFRGQRVTVVGGGQSALESAALLRELDVDVDVVVRSTRVHWLSSGSKRFRSPLLRKLLYAPLKKLLYAPPGVGQALVSHLNAKPGALRLAPDGLRERIDRRSIRPAGASWLRPRLEHVPIHTGVEVVEASRSCRGVQLRFSDGTEQPVDHVLLATGYRVNLAEYSFLDPALCHAIACVGGYPQLSKTFETTVPGLHVIGAPAAYSFGPLMRFVAGSGFAGRSIAQVLTRRATEVPS